LHTFWFFVVAWVKQGRMPIYRTNWSDKVRIALTESPSTVRTTGIRRSIVRPRKWAESEAFMVQESLVKLYLQNSRFVFLIVFLDFETRRIDFTHFQILFDFSFFANLLKKLIYWINLLSVYNVIALWLYFCLYFSKSHFEVHNY